MTASSYERQQLIDELLSPSAVELAYTGISRDCIFHRVADLVEENCHVPKEHAYRAFCAREEMPSTALVHGAAVAHRRLSRLPRPLGVFLRMAKEAPHDDEEKSAGLVFAFLVPENVNTLHLNVLAQLMQVLSNPKQREKLNSATDQAEVCAIFFGTR